jgi:hypothetical protein
MRGKLSGFGYSALLGAVIAVTSVRPCSGAPCLSTWQLPDSVLHDGMSQWAFGTTRHGSVVTHSPVTNWNDLSGGLPENLLCY